jgi:hypothetical protein
MGKNANFYGYLEGFIHLLVPWAMFLSLPVASQVRQHTERRRSSGALRCVAAIRGRSPDSLKPWPSRIVDLPIENGDFLYAVVNSYVTFTYFYQRVYSLVMNPNPRKQKSLL